MYESVIKGASNNSSNNSYTSEEICECYKSIDLYAILFYIIALIYFLVGVIGLATSDTKTGYGLTLGISFIFLITAIIFSLLSSINCNCIRVADIYAVIFFVLMAIFYLVGVIGLSSGNDNTGYGITLGFSFLFLLIAIAILRNN